MTKIPTPEFPLPFEFQVQLFLHSCLTLDLSKYCGSCRVSPRANNGQRVGEHTPSRFECHAYVFLKPSLAAVLLLMFR